MNGEKIITIILILFGGAILLATGYFLGIGFSGKKQNTVTNSDSLQTEEIKIIDSKIIKNISASGRVDEIDASNRIITIIDGEEKINVYVKKDAQISLITLIAPTKIGKPSTTKQVQAVFSDIKIGDQVSATIKILQGNKIETSYIVVVPL